MGNYFNILFLSDWRLETGGVATHHALTRGWCWAAPMQLVVLLYATRVAVPNISSYNRLENNINVSHYTLYCI